MDLKARSTSPVVGATSNPGTTRLSPGGVARNVADNLARLGTPVRLVAVVGADTLGDDLLGATAEAGVDVSLVRRAATPTGTYTAVLDASGELVVAIADMAATDSLDPGDVDAAAEAIAAAALVVIDGNLAPAPLARALDLARAAGVRVLLDPVSVPKATRIAAQVRDLFAVTPNADELAALGGAEALHARGVELVWERRGTAGSRLHTPGGASDLASVATTVVDVTGAGDSMLAAFYHALIAGAAPTAAAAYGHRAAALTVASHDTVRADLADRLGAP
ncbi:MAG: carbohydrate kinase [Actinobacteria bacterium]|nr:carbohydrate kinase [Actinomycetota bacterium]